MLYILSQILVVIADICFVFSMFSKKKSGVVVFLLCSDVIFAVHYFLLNSGTGAAILILDATFLMVEFILEKTNKTKFTPIAIVVAMLGTVILTILTWNGFISLLPMFAILSYLVGMLFNNVVIVKFGALVRNLINVVYLLILASYVGAALEFCLMISAIVGIVLSFKRNRKKNTSENAESK